MGIGNTAHELMDWWEVEQDDAKADRIKEVFDRVMYGRFLWKNSIPSFLK